MKSHRTGFLELNGWLEGLSSGLAFRAFAKVPRAVCFFLIEASFSANSTIETDF